jgi:hypothetical protein
VGLHRGNKPVIDTLFSLAQITISGWVLQSSKNPGLPSQLTHSATQFSAFEILTQLQGIAVVVVVVLLVVDVVVDDVVVVLVLVVVVVASKQFILFMII